jgi:hypothetical protein
MERNIKNKNWMFVVTYVNCKRDNNVELPGINFRCRIVSRFMTRGFKVLKLSLF